MDLPAEILLQILHYIEPKDRFNYLTVCRQWSAPVQNSLYVEAYISSFGSFIKFSSRVKYDKSSLARSVITIKLVNTKSWDFDSRLGHQKFIKYKLNAVVRCCVNLKELDFDGPELWGYLSSLPKMWEEAWLKLIRLPPYDSKAARNVYGKLKHKLTSAKLILRRKTAEETIGILLGMKRLELLELEQYNRISKRRTNIPVMDSATQRHLIGEISQRPPVHFPRVKMILSSLPNLKHLIVKCPISIQRTDSVTLSPLKFLKTFSCYIHHPDTAWFSIIQENFSHMTELDINITIATILENNISLYVHEIERLYKQAEAKKISISFNEVYCAQSINKFLCPILQITELIQPEISITLDIYDRTFPDFVQEEYRISSTYYENTDEDCKHTARHDLQIKSDLNTGLARGEIAPISDLVNVPLRKVNGRLKLSLEHVVTLKLKRCILLKGEEKFHLSIYHLLAEFPQLQYLVVSSENKVATGNTHHGECNCKIDVNFRQSPHNYFVEHESLETIRLEHLCIGISVFNFLMGWCPNLKCIHMVDCVWDCSGKYRKDDRISSLMALCKARNITLYIE